MAEFEGLNFLQWIYRHLKPLLIIQVIALVCSVLFSSGYFMPKEYKSYAVVYPSNMMDYSHESPSEQMIEFLNSVDIKNEVIAKFDLYKHYFKLPRNGKPMYDKLYHKYDRNVVISPTFYRAVELDVTDVSPDTAYEMVTSILDILNKKLLRVQKEKAIEVAAMWKYQLNLKQHQIDSMSAISKQLSSQYGLLIYNNQSKEISKAYYQSLASGKDSKQSDELVQQMKNYEDHAIDFLIINKQIEAAVDDENTLGANYAGAMKDVNKHFTYWNMVSAPYKADSPCYPSRMLFILCVCAGVFIFSVVFIRSIEKIKIHFFMS